MINIVSLSGGKDSVALWLWALRTGLDPVAVYQDTGWEWDEPDELGQTHYAHLDLLESRLGKIHRIAAPLAFEAQVAKKQMFPRGGYGGQGGQWCTKELKLTPFRAWLKAFRETVSDEVTVLLGIRREESAKRADPVQTPEHERSDFYGCDVWRPILDWTIQDVIAEHRRAAIPMHPLYHHGAERVGCFPCIHASKAELEIVGRLAPKRVARIRELEATTGGTMFTRDRRTEKKRLIAAGASPDEAGPSVVPIGIDEVLAWAKTGRGGKQIELVRTPSGCGRWGTCEAAPPESQKVT